MKEDSTDVFGWARPKKVALLDLGGLYAAFGKLRDRRKPRGKRYGLAVVLVLIVLAKLCGEDQPTAIAEWVQARREVLVNAFGLKRCQVPCHNTYRRVLSQAVSSKQLTHTVARFLLKHRRSEGKKRLLICMDGKTLRGTIPVGQSRGVHLLAAYLPEEGIVLVQVPVEAKEKEITAAPHLLKCLDLRRKVVMGDAMLTQQDLSAQIVEGGGEYIWMVKDNHPQHRRDIEMLFEPERCVRGFSPGVTDFRGAQECGKAHGRIERREICVSSALKGYLQWPYHEQVFRLQRDRVQTNTGKEGHQTVYGLTSLTAQEANAKDLLTLTRSYWNIENGLHHRRDKTMREDATRITNPSLAQGMAVVNNLVLGLILQAAWRYLPSARRYYNAHFAEAVGSLHQPA